MTSAVFFVPALFLSSEGIYLHLDKEIQYDYDIVTQTMRRRVTIETKLLHNVLHKYLLEFFQELSSIVRCYD